METWYLSEVFYRKYWNSFYCPPVTLMRVAGGFFLGIFSYNCAHVKFMEQAFEWNIMSYQFYPYYWANKGRWTVLTDFTCDDMLFTKFMQSGMARVVLTVRPGFEDAVNWFMATNEVWNGGTPPVIDNPLYLDLVDELEEQEYVLEGGWETRIPTTLTVIQEGIVGLQTSGLPCDPDCKEYSESGFYKKDDSVLANLNTEKKEG